MRLKPRTQVEAGGGSSSTLVRFLASVRVRQFATSLLASWVVATSAVLLLGALLLASRRSWWGQNAPTLEPPQITQYVIVGALIATVCALTWTVVRSPSRRVLAGRVDAALRLGSLAATATEHLPRSPSEPLPVRAMFEELEESLARSRPAEVVRPRLRGWFALLPASLGIVALSAALPLEHRSSRESFVEVEASVDQVASDLDLLATLLQQGAAEGDVQLERFVPELLQIKDEVDAAGTVDAVVAERLTEALESLATSAAASTSASARQLTAAFAEVAAGRAPGESPEQPFRFGSDEPTRAGSDRSEDPTNAVKAPDFDPASVFRTLGEVASALERQADGSRSETETASTEQGLGSARSSGYYTDWDEEMAALQAAQRAAIRERGRGQAVAGEAAQSDDSMGDAAGRGSQPLEQGAAEMPASLLELAPEEFTIVAELREGGDTNSYLPEPVEGRPLETGMSTALRDSLVAGTEVPTSRETIVSGNRDVIAAYFGRGDKDLGAAGNR